jgi:hypothetical protein
LLFSSHFVVLFLTLADCSGTASRIGSHCRL